MLGDILPDIIINLQAEKRTQGDQQTLKKRDTHNQFFENDQGGKLSR